MLKQFWKAFSDFSMILAISLYFPIVNYNRKIQGNRQNHWKIRKSIGKYREIAKIIEKSENDFQNSFKIFLKKYFWKKNIYIPVKNSQEPKNHT